MNLSRRGFLAGIIAAGVAPAIIRAGIIMPIKPALIVPATPQNIERGGLILMHRKFGGATLKSEGTTVVFEQISTQYRWVRTSLLGEPDPANVSEAIAVGWEPVPGMERPFLVSSGILRA